MRWHRHPGDQLIERAATRGHDQGVTRHVLDRHPRRRRHRLRVDARDRARRGRHARLTGKNPPNVLTGVMTPAYRGDIAAHAATTEGATIMILADIVVVACNCGTLPLNTHANSTAAWKFAAAHVALTGKCNPTMFRDTVPAALAPKAGA